MIKVHCRTNIDSCKLAKFPEEMLAVPRIGERVCAIGSTYIRGNGGSNRTIEQLELYVVGVVYGSRTVYKKCFDPDCDCDDYSDNRNAHQYMEPYVEIELHHPHCKEMGLI